MTGDGLVQAVHHVYQGRARTGMHLTHTTSLTIRPLPQVHASPMSYRLDFTT